MPTPQEKLAYLRGSLDAEIDAITEKLPWYERTIIVLSIVVAATAGSIACGLVTLKTVGAALIPCVLALIALIAAVIKLFLARSSASKEADALEQKKAQMEALVAEME
jgi:hypothetical protein